MNSGHLETIALEEVAKIIISIPYYRQIWKDTAQNKSMHRASPREAALRLARIRLEAREFDGMVP